MSNNKGDNLHHKTLSIMLADKIKYVFRAKLPDVWEGMWAGVFQCFTDKRVEFSLGQLMFSWLTYDLPALLWADLSPLYANPRFLR